MALVYFEKFTFVYMLKYHIFAAIVAIVATIMCFGLVYIYQKMVENFLLKLQLLLILFFFNIAAICQLK